MDRDPPRTLFFEAHPEPMWIYDLETLRFLEVNDAAIEKYGYSRGEFLAMTLADIRPPDDVQALEDNVAAVTEGLDKAGIWRHRLKSGELVDVEITSHTIEREGRRAEVVLARDATRLVELERAQATYERQREQDANLRTAQRLLGLGFWKFDFATGALTWSDEVYDMYGVPHGAFDETFEAYVELVHPDDREQMLARFEEFTAAGEPHFYFEHRIVRPAGGVIHVRGAGEISERGDGRILTGVVEDITTRKESELAVRESEERFRIIAKATNEVLWDWDLVAGTIWWNENFTEMFGYDPNELEPGPESWSNRIHPEDRDAVLEDIHAVIDGAGTSWESEYRFMHANGSAVTVIDRGYVIRDADGTPKRMVGSMIDVSERRALDERLKQSQKLEAVGQLTGGVAHDFNNLLTVILGNADLLREQLRDQPELRSLAGMAAEAAGRGAELTSRLLAFARRQPLEPKHVDINRLVAGMDGLLRRTLTEEIEIEFVRAGGLWQVEVDPGQLEGALLNLAINARDAMPSGGRLTIETANASLDDDYASRHDDVVAGQYVVISVTDTGTGMPADTVARAFDPFFTTKPPGEGSGLGLSMVYGFVKQSGGHAKIYTEPGEGTAVKLYFPRAREQAATIEPAVEPETVAGGRERILVVEDEELVREHVKRQLEGLGYAVRTAGSGPEALELFEHGEEVDLLFTDVVMPGGMNGRELADAARSRQPGLRVLFTSGYTENAIVHHGRLDRGVELLSKPYRRQDLAAKLRKVLEAPAA